MVMQSPFVETSRSLYIRSTLLHWIRFPNLCSSCRASMYRVNSVFGFCRLTHTSYPYVSHLICNAGIAPFTGINWLTCFRQILLDPLGAFTTPNFYRQSWGELSQDGYGFTWQCNVFGHYTLVRTRYHTRQLILTVHAVPRIIPFVIIYKIPLRLACYMDVVCAINEDL